MNNGKFYVYIHRRKTDNSIFYVGKGSGNRVFSKSGRSNHWRNIVKKHDYIVEIIRYFNCELEAYEYETHLIGEMRSNMERICNVANGGEGGLSGTKLKDEHKEKLRKAKLGKKQLPEHAKKSSMAKIGKKQPRSAVEYVIGLKKKKVINSDGEIFDSATEAARSLSKRLGITASQGNISMVCRGERCNAYGLSWSYDTKVIPTVSITTVFCDNGMKFNSTKEAAEWVKKYRGRALSSNITNAVRNNGTAYGFRWHVEVSNEAPE